VTADEIEQALGPHLRDGSEAIEAIVQLMQSPYRPPDLRLAVAKVLQQQRAHRCDYGAARGWGTS
jgi:hypothetical protein